MRRSLSARAAIAHSRRDGWILIMVSWSVGTNWSEGRNDGTEDRWEQSCAGGSSLLGPVTWKMFLVLQLKQLVSRYVTHIEC